ncbi:wall-associated receptor kinase-like 2-like [Hibiscus syriacus]|uniref:Wall-associated receptor kinase-like 2-like n=1 Tax=Hibiscus syriacus TaxID=106335 RepID=A0A6A3CPH8_HIBSY|nr:glycine-rich RNA-binding protein 4, mitochondrial-like [Hibiscus syriacus]XP_039041150.1 glycine-rich RNA-binding protein 4, mitochondrial-like [Hibiscus syriacus]KAE8729482.1 wall-associated receptor kinase-like 2-like [Hibiscus syriacus]
MQSINGTVRGFCKYPLAGSLWARNSCSKLFVGGLSYDTNETVLKNAFERHGEIIEVRVVARHVSEKSRGYGFVRFTSEASAIAALKEMHSRVLDGRNIRVEFTLKG